MPARTVRLPLPDSHLLWWRVPTPSGRLLFPVAGPTTPAMPQHRWFGLFPPRSPLRRESRLISLRRATEMFQFAHCPPSCLCIQQAVSSHHAGRVAPFGFSGLTARMQLPLNVSPVSASFFGLQRLGIHLVLCLACALLRCARRACAWHARQHAQVQTHTYASSATLFSLFLPWQY
jgi:hypothetical protein